MHRTTFHAESGDVLLFSSWILHGKKETYLACLMIVVLGIVYQGIKFARQQYGRKCQNINCKRYMLTKDHLLQTVLYVLQFGGGYVLMLSAMTYNIWLLVSVLVGFGLGYFFFGWGEYEEAAGIISVPTPTCRHNADGRSCPGARGSARSGGLLQGYATSCGIGGMKASDSTASANQELLLLSKSEEEVGEIDLSRSNCGACHCGTSKV